MVQPDILVICDEDKIDENDTYQGIPSLVVEVISKSTRSKDMIKKLSLYMKSGVDEYWLVDNLNEKIIIYAMEEREIKNVWTVNFGDVLESVRFPGLKIQTEVLK